MPEHFETHKITREDDAAIGRLVSDIEAATLALTGYALELNRAYQNKQIGKFNQILEKYHNCIERCINKKDALYFYLKLSE